MIMDKQKLNVILNKALIGKDRIKGVPSSNKIANFVNNYLDETEDVFRCNLNTDECVTQCTYCEYVIKPN